MILQSLPELLSACRGKSPVIDLSVQRATAVVTLLIHVTQTAGYAAELEGKLSRWVVPSPVLCIWVVVILSSVSLVWRPVCHLFFFHFGWFTVPYVNLHVVGYILSDTRSEVVSGVIAVCLLAWQKAGVKSLHSAMGQKGSVSRMPCWREVGSSFDLPFGK